MGVFRGEPAPAEWAFMEGPEWVQAGAGSGFRW
jgi:hypothetical protein